MFSKKQTICIKGKLLDLSKPKIMGIVNITPDSFFDGGMYNSSDKLNTHVETLINQGADILDLGACSARPGASEISFEEEKKRLGMALEVVYKLNPQIPISVDTYRSGIAEWAIEHYDIDIVNDISGGTMDPKLFEVVGKHNKAAVIMHIRGNPGNMQKQTNYNDLLKDVITALAIQVDKAKQAGVCDIIVDPGFGFAKTIEQNFELLNHLDLFNALEHPILVGVSRKSLIYKSLNTEPQHALNGTTALNIFALQNGANILRVHDIIECKEVIKLFLKLKAKNFKEL